MSGTGFRRADLSETDEMAVAAVHVDTAGNRSEARAVAVTPLGEIAGADGEDGQGVEYVFAVTQEADPPEDSPQNDWKYEDPKGSWSDGLTGLGESKPYAWRSQRRVPGSPDHEATPDSETWGNWTTPVIVARYGPPGAAGVDGVDGSDGRDGQGVEYVFATTAGASAPSDSPDDGWSYDSPPSESSWSDAMPNLSAEKPYGWRSERRVPGSPARGLRGSRRGAVGRRP